MEKEKQLRNPDIFPSDKALSEAMGYSYTAFKKLNEELPGYGCEIEWRYYNDTKSWLGKCICKKKTVFWLAAWDGYFSMTFYFTEKTREGVYNLPIDKEYKKILENPKKSGKLIPLMLEVRDESMLDDVYELIEYKRKLK